VLYVVPGSLVPFQNGGNASCQRTSTAIMNKLVSQDNKALGMGGSAVVVLELGQQITMSSRVFQGQVMSFQEYDIGKLCFLGNIYVNMAYFPFLCALHV